MSDSRRGDWIQTFTGRQFWPLDPRPGDFVIEDIAHALSNQCRYGGHAQTFYSVAEHCWILSHVFTDRFLALTALMHDAAEAYLVDVPRPIKAALGTYYDIERGIEVVLAEQFPDLLYPFPDEVMDADTRILTDERQQLMVAPPIAWGTAQEPLGVHVQCWPPRTAEIEFLGRWSELGDHRA